MDPQPAARDVVAVLDQWGAALKERLERLVTLAQKQALALRQAQEMNERHTQAICALQAELDRLKGPKVN